MLGKLHSRTSGILGDEMGLGKTIQTAVFLQLARERGLTTGPTAVVVPLRRAGLGRGAAQRAVGLGGVRRATPPTDMLLTSPSRSTLAAWERELAKWAPGLEVLTYSGPQEARHLIATHELGAKGESMDAVRRFGAALLPRQAGVVGTRGA